MISFARSLMIIAAAVVCMAGGVARADVLTLANGDKLTGKLVRNEGGVITFKSDILGEISVPAAKASVKADPPAQPKKKPKATTFTEVDLRTAARTPERATKVDDTGWINRIEFGLASQSGRRDKLDIYLRTENNRRTPLTETRFLNRYTYGRDAGMRTADSISSNLRFRRTLSRRVFLQSNSRYDRDTIKLLNSDAEQGFGLGANVFGGKAVVISAGAGAAARYRAYMRGSAPSLLASSQFTSVLNAFQDMSVSFSQRFAFTQDFQAVVAPQNNSDYKLNFNAGLTGKVTDTFAITTRLELEYDRSLLPSDLRYNQRITTTLVYVF